MKRCPGREATVHPTARNVCMVEYYHTKRYFSRCQLKFFCFFSLFPAKNYQFWQADTPRSC